MAYTINVVNSSLFRTLKDVVNINVSIGVLMTLNKDVFKVINIIINKLITG